jgi:hypothetical protein
MTECECKTWCSDGRPPLTEHHRNCPKRNLEAESVALVSALIKGIENWSADEDGVHPDAWDAYCRAIVFVGDLAKLKVVLEKSEDVVPPNAKLSDASEAFAPESG